MTLPISEVGFILIAVLIILLVEREVARTWLSPKGDLRWQALDVAAGPLFVVFIVIAASRLAELWG